MSITLDQTAAILARLNDGRTIDDFEIGDWHQVLNTDPRINVEDGLQAVVNFRADPDNKRRATPADILAGARQIRKVRLASLTDEQICAEHGHATISVTGHCSRCGTQTKDATAA